MLGCGTKVVNTGGSRKAFSRVDTLNHITMQTSISLGNIALTITPEGSKPMQNGVIDGCIPHFPFPFPIPYNFPFGPLLRGMALSSGNISREYAYSRADLNKHIVNDVMPKIMEVSGDDAIHKMMSQIYLAHPGVKEEISSILKEHNSSGDGSDGGYDPANAFPVPLGWFLLGWVVKDGIDMITDALKK